MWSLLIKGVLDTVFVSFQDAVTKSLLGNNLKEKEMAFHHGGRYGSIQLRACETAMGSHFLTSLQKRSRETRLGERPSPNNNEACLLAILSPAKSHLLKVPQPSKAMSAAGDQVLKLTSL